MRQMLLPFAFAAPRRVRKRNRPACTDRRLSVTGIRLLLLLFTAFGYCMKYYKKGNAKKQEAVFRRMKARLRQSHFIYEKAIRFFLELPSVRGILQDSVKL